MTPDDGLKPDPAAEKSLGEIVGEVSEKASLLIREEIELAKAEVQDKVSKLAKGAGVGAAAGMFLGFVFAFFLHTMAWFLVDLLNLSSDQIWIGFGITTVFVLLLAVVAGLLAVRWLRGGSPPTPELAIEEARRTREELERQSIERDQVGRTLGRGKELKA
jgi:Putative Actinobacterial Holin-X, holin superfamily III